MTDADVEAQIFSLLALRKPHMTICPSEVARALVPEGGDWRHYMPQVRQVAQALAQQHRLRVTRGAVPVDATVPGGRFAWGCRVMTSTPDNRRQGLPRLR